MPWTDFTLRLQTPAFLDDPAARFRRPTPDTARFRRPTPDTDRVPFPVSSLRGVLRYWLRALVGAHVGNDLESLATVEREVFGAASGRDGSPSTIQLRSRTLITLTREPPAWLPRGTGSAAERAGSAVQYLLGQGLWSGRDGLSRRYVPEQTEIVLSVDHRSRRAAGADLFLAALWCASMYGGLGARTRRCFGTFTVDPPDLPGEFDADLFHRAAIADLPAVTQLAVRAATVLHPQLGQQPGRPRYPALAPGWFEDSDEPLDRVTSLADALAAAGKQVRAHRLGRPDDRTVARWASPLWLRVYHRNDVWCLRSLALLAEWLPTGTRPRVRDTTSQGGRRQPRRPVTTPTQDQVDEELRGWFAGGRPAPHTASAAPPTTAPHPPTPAGQPPGPKPGPRPGPPPGR